MLAAAGLALGGCASLQQQTPYAGRSIAEVVGELGARRVTEPKLRRYGDAARITFNVNTPADLQRAEEMLAARS